MIPNYWKFLIFLLLVIKMGEVCLVLRKFHSGKFKNLRQPWSLQKSLFNQSYSSIFRGHQHHRKNKMVPSKVRGKIMYVPQMRFNNRYPPKHLKRKHKIKLKKHFPQHVKKNHRRILRKRKFKPYVDLVPFYGYKVLQKTSRTAASKTKDELENPNAVLDELFPPFLDKPNFNSKVKARNVSDEFAKDMFEDYIDNTTTYITTAEFVFSNSEPNAFTSQQSLNLAYNRKSIPLFPVVNARPNYPYQMTLPLNFSTEAQSSPVLFSSMNRQFQPTLPLQNFSMLFPNASIPGSIGNLSSYSNVSIDGNTYQPQETFPIFRNLPSNFQQQQPAQFTIERFIIPSTIRMNAPPGTEVLYPSTAVSIIKNETTIFQYLQDKINNMKYVYNRFGNKNSLLIISMLLSLLFVTLAAIIYYKHHKEMKKRKYPFKKRNKFSLLRTSRQEQKDLLTYIDRIRSEDLSSEDEVDS